MDPLSSIIKTMKESTNKDTKSFRKALKESKENKLSDIQLSEKQAEIKENRLQKVTEALKATKEANKAINESSSNKQKLESIKKDFGMKAEKKNDRLEKILKKAEAAREEKKACEGDACKDSEYCKKKECGDKEQRRAEAHKRLMQCAKERQEAMRRGECGKRECGKGRVGNLRRKENRSEECDGKECDRRAEMKRAEARREAICNARERAEAKRRMERLESRIEARHEEMKEAMKRRAIRRRIAESREEALKQNKHESLVNRIRNARKYR